MVCKILKTNLDADRHFRVISSLDFDTPLKRKAQIYASIHKPNSIRANPISRQAITNYSGITKATQIRLEKVAKVHKVPNYGMLQVDDKVAPIKVEVVGKSKVYQVNKRLPNSYRTAQLPGNKGMLKVTSKRLRSLIVGEAPALVKRYFAGIRKLVRALEHRGEGIHEGFYRVPSLYRSIHGRQEWAAYSIYA